MNLRRMFRLLTKKGRREAKAEREATLLEYELAVLSKLLHKHLREDISQRTQVLLITRNYTAGDRFDYISKYYCLITLIKDQLASTRLKYDDIERVTLLSKELSYRVRLPIGYVNLVLNKPIVDIKGDYELDSIYLNKKDLFYLIGDGKI